MKQTALFEQHQALGAMFTDFGGWNMPVRYGNELDEHRAVRTSAGLFDISHMAEIRVTGPQAGAFLDFALVNPSSAIAISKAKYNLICNEQGTVIDDLIVYRLGEQEFLVVANAGNRFNVVAALEERIDGFANAILTDESDDWALIALQGPVAAEILQPLCDQDLTGLKYYAILEANVAGIPILVGRTGYTGEDGFELFTPASYAAQMWQALLAAGGERLLPCGLASRDTLRLEAGMPLYGQELDLEHNPYQAGFAKVLKLDRNPEDGNNGNFVGKVALEELAANEPDVKLVGLVGEGRRAARHGYELFALGGETAIGVVTSGALSPTLGYPIAMAYVSTADPSLLLAGATIEVDIRGSRQPLTITNLPFYKRQK